MNVAFSPFHFPIHEVENFVLILPERISEAQTLQNLYKFVLRIIRGVREVRAWIQELLEPIFRSQ